MAVYIGSSSYRHSAFYSIVLVFLGALALFAILGFATTSILWAIGSGLSLFAPLGFALLSVGMTASTRGLSRMKRMGRIERIVDGALGELPDEYFVYCGRGWTGETASRDSDYSATVRGVTVTDSSGRAFGSIRPDRVVIGPSGTWLVVVEQSVTSADAPARRGSARGLAIDLGRYLDTAYLGNRTDPSLFKPSAVVVAVEQAVFIDVSTGRSSGLHSLAQAIETSPDRLSPSDEHDLKVTMALCYNEKERGYALDALDRRRMAV